jgi:hypothetical protein
MRLAECRARSGWKGETVLDVRAKLSAQVRVFATGNGRKTDPADTRHAWMYRGAAVPVKHNGHLPRCA